MDDPLIMGVIITSAIFALIIILVTILRPTHIETPEKRAGRLGEQFATTLIREILTDNDVLLTNVPLHTYDKKTELDNLVVNSHGVFIIEVKNYYGELIGDEDDFEWIKNNMYPAGSFKQTTVKNPIVQVKRQIFILSQVLKEHYIDVRIDGYVFLTERNSPVDSPLVLDTQADMDSVIHGGDIRLTSRMIEQIVSVLVPDEEYRDGFV